jgi:N-hydroxyarylamine O-acetyltransferase
MNVDAYLKRIHYTGSLEPTVETLRELHVAHLLNVPFENLDIHAQRPIILEQSSLFEKIVVQNRGGFCYELNGIFTWLLRSMGFDVTLLSARVSASDGNFGPEYDHLALRVDLEESWLADVGFGDSFREPLHLKESIEQQQTLGTYRLRTAADDWFYDAIAESGQWQSQYSFTLQARELTEFVEMCHYQQTSPDSSFTKRIVCTKATQDGRVTLRNDRLITTRNGHKSEMPILGEVEFHDLLLQKFGIELPHDVRIFQSDGDLRSY